MRLPFGCPYLSNLRSSDGRLLDSGVLGAMLCNCGADELVVCSQFCDVRCAQSISNATALADKA
jgi:hypothetical protein